MNNRIDVDAPVKSKYGIQTVRQFQNGSTYKKVRKSRRRRRLIKRIFICIFSIMLVCVGSFFAYFQILKNNMSYKGDMTDLLNSLTKANYEEPFYVLVIGSDNWEDEGQRADAMVLCRVDLNKPQLTLVTIPRDTAYNFPDGRTYKLNAVYEESGLVACINAVSEVAGVPISDYVEVDFDGLSNVVDKLGGIEVDVPYEIWYTVYTNDQPTVHINAGLQTLNGEQAVALARMRTAYASKLGNGFSEDTVRQANIRAMMSGILKKTLSGSLVDLPGKVSALSEMVTTDVPLETLIEWATRVYKSSGLTLYSTTAPYAGQIYYVNGGSTFLTDDDPETWSTLMAAVDSGVDPETVITTKTNSDGKVSDSSSTVITTGE